MNPEHEWTWVRRIMVFRRQPGIFGEAHTDVSREAWEDAPDRYEAWGLTYDLGVRLMRSGDV